MQPQLPPSSTCGGGRLAPMPSSTSHSAGAGAVAAPVVLLGLSLPDSGDLGIDALHPHGVPDPEVSSVTERCSWPQSPSNSLGAPQERCDSCGAGVPRHLFICVRLASSEGDTAVQGVLLIQVVNVYARLPLPGGVRVSRGADSGLGCRRPAPSTTQDRRVRPSEAGFIQLAGEPRPPSSTTVPRTKAAMSSMPGS